LTLCDQRVPAWTNAKNKDWEMRRMAVYVAMIDRLDRGIGRILDSVEKDGVVDNMLIILISDHGATPRSLPADAALRRRIRPKDRCTMFRPAGQGHCERGMTRAGKRAG
jgi:arylsulfatase